MDVRFKMDFKSAYGELTGGYGCSIFQVLCFARCKSPNHLFQLFKHMRLPSTYCRRTTGFEAAAHTGRMFARVWGEILVMAVNNTSHAVRSGFWPSTDHNRNKNRQHSGNAKMYVSG